MMIIELIYTVYFKCKKLLRKRFTLLLVHPSAQVEYFCAYISTILRESGKQLGSARDLFDRVNRPPNQQSILTSTAYPSLNIQTSSTCTSVHGLEGIAFLRILS